MANVKLRVTKTGDDDGGGGSKPSPQDVAKATAFAKAFALRKALMSGENTHTGGTVPKFYDEAGNDITGKPAGKSNVKLSTFVPPEVTELKEDDTGYPYYEHPQTGEAVHVPQDYRHLPRFNPNRGKSADQVATNLIAKK